MTINRRSGFFRAKHLLNNFVHKWDKLILQSAEKDRRTKILYQFFEAPSWILNLFRNWLRAKRRILPGTILNQSVQRGLWRRRRRRREPLVSLKVPTPKLAFSTQKFDIVSFVKNLNKDCLKFLMLHIWSSSNVNFFLTILNSFV